MCGNACRRCRCLFGDTAWVRSWWCWPPRTFNWARGVITTGCALDAMPKLDGIAGAMLRLASALAPRLRISLGIDATALTQVPEEQRRHMSDPLVPRTASLRLLYGFARACRTCRANAPQDHAALAGGTRGSGPGLPDQRFTHADRRLGLAGQAARDLPRACFTKSTTRTRPRARALFDLMARWMLERA